MEQLARFANEMPAWMGKDGLPFSWQHFAYGSRHLGRESMRRVLDTGAAVRGGMATQEGYAEWREKLEMKA
jgi:hypothetical protein